MQPRLAFKQVVGAAHRRMQNAATMGLRGQTNSSGYAPQRPVTQALVDILNFDWAAYPVVVPVPYRGDMYQAVPSHNSQDSFFVMVRTDNGRAPAEPFRTFFLVWCMR